MAGRTIAIRVPRCQGLVFGATPVILGNLRGPARSVLENPPGPVWQPRGGASGPDRASCIPRTPPLEESWRSDGRRRTRRPDRRHAVYLRRPARNARTAGCVHDKVTSTHGCPGRQWSENAATDASRVPSIASPLLMRPRVLPAARVRSVSYAVATPIHPSTQAAWYKHPVTAKRPLLTARSDDVIRPAPVLPRRVPNLMTRAREVTGPRAVRAGTRDASAAYPAGVTHRWHQVHCQRVETLQHCDELDPRCDEVHQLCDEVHHCRP